MKLGELVEQLLNYDPDLPVRIAAFEEMNGYDWYLRSPQKEICKVTLFVEIRNERETLLIGYREEEFPEIINEV